MADAGGRVAAEDGTSVPDEPSHRFRGPAVLNSASEPAEAPCALPRSQRRRPCDLSLKSALHAFDNLHRAAEAFTVRCLEEVERLGQVGKAQWVGRAVAQVY